jgi:hypothetical protein
MMVGYDRGVVDHTVLLKKKITDEVVYLLGRGLLDNVLADVIENPTEEDYQILGKVTCDILAGEIWPAYDLVHVCEDCIDEYAEIICRRFKQLLQVDQEPDSVRIGDIVRAAAGLVAYCSSTKQDEFYEAIRLKAEEVKRNGGRAEGMVSVWIGGGCGANNQHDS